MASAVEKIRELCGIGKPEKRQAGERPDRLSLSLYLLRRIKGGERECSRIPPPAQAEEEKPQPPTPPSVLAYEKDGGFELIIVDVPLRNAISRHLSEPQSVADPQVDATAGSLRLLNRRFLMLRGNILTGREEDGSSSPIPRSNIRELRQELAEIHPEGRRPKWRFHLYLEQPTLNYRLNH